MKIGHILAYFGLKNDKYLVFYGLRKLYFSDWPFSEGGLFGVLGAFGFNLGVLTKIDRGRYRVVVRAPQGKFSCKTVFL